MDWSQQLDGSVLVMPPCDTTGAMRCGMSAAMVLRYSGVMQNRLDIGAQ